MNRTNFVRTLLVVVLYVSTATAFAPTRAATALPATINKISDPLLAAAVWMSTTLPAIAVVEDDYEYGAVDAPIGIAVAGGLLAILTALLPLFLKGGEEAFEEMKERDADTFGKGKDILNKRK